MGWEGIWATDLSLEGWGFNAALSSPEYSIFVLLTEWHLSKWLHHECQNVVMSQQVWKRFDCEINTFFPMNQWTYITISN